MAIELPENNGKLQKDGAIPTLHSVTEPQRTTSRTERRRKETEIHIIDRPRNERVRESGLGSPSGRAARPPLHHHRQRHRNFETAAAVGLGAAIPSAAAAARSLWKTGNSFLARSAERTLAMKCIRFTAAAAAGSNPAGCRLRESFDLVPHSSRSTRS